MIKFTVFHIQRFKIFLMLHRTTKEMLPNYVYKYSCTVCDIFITYLGKFSGNYISILKYNGQNNLSNYQSLHTVQKYKFYYNFLEEKRNMII